MGSGPRTGSVGARKTHFGLALCLAGSADFVPAIGGPTGSTAPRLALLEGSQLAKACRIPTGSLASQPQGPEYERTHQHQGAQRNREGESSCYGKLGKHQLGSVSSHCPHEGTYLTRRKYFTGTGPSSFPKPTLVMECPLSIFSLAGSLTHSFPSSLAHSLCPSLTHSLTQWTL